MPKKTVRKKPVSPKTTKPQTRRQEYAEQTRIGIISAARTLFARRGYAQTKVEEIAQLARVAPITVYTVVGGKTGLLRILMEIWSTAPGNDTALADIQAQKDPQLVLKLVGQVVRYMREEFGDIAYFMQDAAPHDGEVAESLAVATGRYRNWFVTVVKHLTDLKSLRAGLSLQEAADILWFYFGYWGYYTLHNENGWTYERAEEWLVKAASQSVLKQKG